MHLPVRTIEDIMAQGPCCDPVEKGYLPRHWTGTALDILCVTANDCPDGHKLWVIQFEGWIDEKTMRLFACWCARKEIEALCRYYNCVPDANYLAMIGVGELYAHGMVTRYLLKVVRDSALGIRGLNANDAGIDSYYLATSVVEERTFKLARHVVSTESPWCAADALMITKPNYPNSLKVAHLIETLEEECQNNVANSGDKDNP